MKKVLSIIIALLFLLSLASCGTKSSKSSDSGNYSYNDPDKLVYSNERLALYTVSYTYRNNKQSIKDEKRTIKVKVYEIGGYIDYAYDKDEKYAQYDYKVPTDRLNDFIDYIDENDNYSNKRMTIQDVSSHYSITDGQIESLRNRLQMYQERLEDPNLTLDDQLKIEEQIDELTIQINQLEARQSYYNEDYNYSTVTVYYRYKDTVNPFVRVIANLAIYLGIVLMIAAPFGIIGFVIFMILRKKNKKVAA